MELFARMVDVDGSSGEYDLNPSTDLHAKADDRDNFGYVHTFGELANAMRTIPILEGAPAFIEVRDRDPFAKALGDDDSDKELPIIRNDINDKGDITPVKRSQLPAIHGDGIAMLGTYEFEIGHWFQSKAEVVLTVKNYNICRSVKYKVFESDQLKYHEKCMQFGNGCNLADHIDYHVIYVCVDTIIGYNGCINLCEGFEECGGIKIWFQAKLEEELKRVLQPDSKMVIRVQMYMSGTIAILRTFPVRAGNMVYESRVFFHRLFWIFLSYVETFKYYKPLISMDGISLYDKYGETLLMASAQDENSNILPAAFGLVEGKNMYSWKFFLSNLHQHITPQQRIVVISDRHNTIKAA
ncbi:uncharacterized protein LOC130981319 [Arachis stenosperma]|uniref:uncharacterized protein LOC130981319 n=1 Tax=Arachis stenosperma TaxID=217475 RepID=UPI0025AC54F8|nr:uncharacterized protein LOC130981319 [Arachis stenosperma]